MRFEVWSAPDLHVFNCNCSICTKKQNRHFIVPKFQFTLLQGSENITTYTFNTHMAKHTFCKTCGVQSFYTPRSNPDGLGVAPHCLDPGTVSSVTVEDFCGQNWEESMQKHQTIRSMSRPTTDTWLTVSIGQLSPTTKLYSPASQGSFNYVFVSPWTKLKDLWLLSVRCITVTVYTNVLQIRAFHTALNNGLSSF